MPKTYRWGFVGAGWIARAMAADMIGVPGCEIYGVVSGGQQSAAAFGREVGTKVFTSLATMLADRQIDIVYVNSPNHLHFQQVKQALLAGKPVLCEKPFTLNAKQLTELIDLAQSQNLFLMEAMWVRFLPAIIRLRNLLAASAIGDLQWLHASFHSKPPRVASNRFYDLGMGGGSLLDLGIYPISFASMVFGVQPQRIASMATLAETGVDERFAALFEYAAGRQAALSAGFGGSFSDEISIQGSEGQIRIPRLRGWTMEKLIIERQDRVDEFNETVAGRGYSYQAAEVIRCLGAGHLESPAMPLSESLAIMRTLDKLRSQWGIVFPGE